MKAKTIPIFLTLGLGGLLTSCVDDPYYVGGSATVSSYRPGYVVSSLPPYYETEIIGGVQYYRRDNIYYRPRGNRYVIVEAPRGSRGWSDRNRDGRQYRYDGRDDRGGRGDGRYDRDDRGDGRYDRDGRGDGRYDRDDRRGGARSQTTVIRTLPNGAREVVHQGRRYYRAGDTYYQARGNEYMIVERPF